MKTNRITLAIVSLLVMLSMVLSACGGAAGTANPTQTEATPTTVAGAEPTATPATAEETPSTSDVAPSTDGSGPERVPADQLPIAPPKGVTSKKDTLVFAMSQEPSSIFPLFESAAVAQTAADPIFDSVVARDAQDNLYPELAWYVPTLENGGAYYVGEGDDRHLAVKYELRPGINWSDGAEITSKDILFTHNLILDPLSTIQDRTLWEKVNNVETPDKYTAIFHFMSANQAIAFLDKAEDKEHFAFLQTFVDAKAPVVDPLFNLVGANIYPEHVLGKIPADKITESAYARNPVASGPFMIERWDSGSQIVLVQNPNYNLTDKPLLNRIVIKIINDTNQIVAQLKTGDLDGATSDAFPAPTDVLDTLGQAGQKVEYVPARQWEHVDFNVDNEIFKDKTVRQAITYAINRQNLVDQIYRGKSIVLNTFLPPASWASMQNEEFAKQFEGQFKLNDYAYDPDKANQMLDEAGWVKGSDGIRVKDGVRLSFDYATTAGNKLREQVTQLVQVDLKKVGIDARLQYIPADSYFADDGYLAKRQLAFAQYAWVLDVDPSGSLYDSQYVPSEANNYSGANYSGWKNAEFDRLSRAASNELEREKRAPLFAEMQQIWNDELPTVPLFTRLNIEVHKDALVNWETSAGTTYPTYKAAAMYFK